MESCAAGEPSTSTKSKVSDIEAQVKYEAEVERCEDYPGVFVFFSVISG